MKVLLVSDDIDLRVALQILLREEPGCDIIGALSHSAAAVSLLQNETPDLLLLDWDLPARSASSLLTAVNDENCHPHVIAIGRHEADEAEALREGVDIFVLNGGSPEILLRAIRGFSDDH